MADLNKKDQETVASSVSAEKKEKKPKKNKKPNIFKRLGRFFRESFSEMKKVTWLSRKETVKSSLIVLAVTIALCVLIGVVDTALQAGVIGLKYLG